MSKPRIITNIGQIYPILENKVHSASLNIKPSVYYGAWTNENSRNPKVLLSSFEGNKKRH